MEQGDANELNGALRAQYSGVHENDEERLDLDVRSIMLANDKLVRQLARSVGAAEDDGSGHDDEDDERLDETNNSVERMRRPGRDQQPDYELDKLEELVAKTIEDYAQRSYQQPADRELDIARKQASLEGKGEEQEEEEDDNNNADERYNEAGDKINEAFANTNGKLLSIEENQVNSSSGLAPPVSGRPRRSYGIRGSASRMLNHIAGQKQPVDDRLCGSQSEAVNEQHDKPVYRDCIELPECESGGQCVVELTSKNNNNNDNNNNSDRQGRLGSNKLQPRARCRCPVGRGGHLCQKRK